MIIIFILAPYNASVVSATPSKRVSLTAVPISLTYAIITFYIQLFYFTLLLLLYLKPQNTLLHNTRILSCYLELYLAILFSVFTSRILRLQTPASSGIDIFISKLATNDLCTCSHQQATGEIE